jgi:hypothetical protein
MWTVLAALVAGVGVFFIESVLHPLLVKQVDSNSSGTHDSNKKWSPRNVIIGAALAALIHLFYVVVEKLQETNNRIERLTLEIEESIQGTRAEVLAAATDRILSCKSLVHKAALENLLIECDRRHADIAGEVVHLEEEEVGPIWQTLIGDISRKSVDATNIVSPKDWEYFSPDKGMEAHVRAIKSHKVNIRRLFIFDYSEWPRYRKVGVYKCVFGTATDLKPQALAKLS